MYKLTNLAKVTNTNLSQQAQARVQIEKNILLPRNEAAGFINTDTGG
jgi:hypothetical protein